MDAGFVKSAAERLGADLCQIASVDRFVDAPQGFHPTDVFPHCRSVVVFLSRFPTSFMAAKSLAPYTFIRNMMVKQLEEITFGLCQTLEQGGALANPVLVDEPYEYWDGERQHGRGIISLKHAAVLAGLGTLGKNTLLVNPKYGNMIWLGAVLTDLELDADPLVHAQACLPDCKLCLEVCPGNALDGITIDQKICRTHSFSWTPGGGALYECNQCRTICPRARGTE